MKPHRRIREQAGLVLLSIPIVARRDDFPSAELAARSHVGQVVTLRPIVNRPAGSNPNPGETPTPSAPYVGQPILAAAGFQPARSDRSSRRKKCTPQKLATATSNPPQPQRPVSPSNASPRSTNLKYYGIGEVVRIDANSALVEDIQSKNLHALPLAEETQV